MPINEAICATDFLGTKVLGRNTSKYIKKTMRDVINGLPTSNKQFQDLNVLIYLWHNIEILQKRGQVPFDPHFSLNLS
jgi:hypothetical protein